MNKIVIKNQAVQQIARAINIAAIRPPTQTANQFDSKVQVFEPDAGLYKSLLGTPVMQDLTFGTATYTDQDTGREKKTPVITLINFLLTVTQEKNIVKTPIHGSNGTIKEYIGLGDYQIKIN